MYQTPERRRGDDRIGAARRHSSTRVTVCARTCDVLQRSSAPECRLSLKERSGFSRGGLRNQRASNEHAKVTP